MGRTATTTDTGLSSPYTLPVYVEPSIADVLLNQASASQPSTGNSAGISVTNYHDILIGINITAVTAGSVIFSIQSLGADGIQYTLWASASQTAAGQVVTSIGPGCAQANALGQTIRLVWTIVTGPVTFSASIIGRQSV